MILDLTEKAHKTCLSTQQLFGFDARTQRENCTSQQQVNPKVIISLDSIIRVRASKSFLPLSSFALCVFNLFVLVLFYGIFPDLSEQFFSTTAYVGFENHDPLNDNIASGNLTNHDICSLLVSNITLT